MVLSITGSHGVGKTSTINYIKKSQSDWIYISEATRKIIPVLGYDNPYKLVDEYGIAFYESIFISQWACLEVLSIDYKNKIVLLDRSPIDNLAYYYLHRENHEKIYEPILAKLAKYYLQFIDDYIYFPTGIFEFAPDIMQRTDTQLFLDKIILNLLKKFEIKYYTIKEISIDKRAEEVIEYIGKKG